jgi:hypothetical protein
MFRYMYLLGLLSTFFNLFTSVATTDESKRPLEHLDYDRWNILSTTRISNDGQWILYGINSGKADGDATLVIRKNGATKEYRVVRGRSANFTFDSKFVIYEIAPDPKLIKKLKKEKTKEIPKPIMEVLELKSGESFHADRIKSFTIPKENGRWLAYLLEKQLNQESIKEHKSDVVETYEITLEGLRRPTKPLKLKKRKTEEEIAQSEQEKTPNPEAESKEKPSKEESESDSKSKEKKKEIGTVLAIRDLQTNEERRFPNVASFRISKNGASLAFVTSVEKSSDKKSDDMESKNDAEPKDSMTDGVYVLNLENQELTQIISGFGHYKNLSFSENGEELAFVTNKDDYDAKTSSWSLYHWKQPSNQAELVADWNRKTRNILPMCPPQGSVLSSCWMKALAN